MILVEKVYGKKKPNSGVLAGKSDGQRFVFVGWFVA